MRTKLQQVALITLGAVLGVLITLNFSAVAEKSAGPLPIEDLRAFTEVFGRVKSDYVEPVDDKKLISEAINGMLSGLDPHSAYLDAEAFRELQVGTQGEFGGLGIEVGMEDGFVKVISPIEDTPAYRAGLKSGDLIIKLDDTNVKGMTLNDAVKRMRGKPNTDITLTIIRKGDPKPKIVTLTRAVIQIQSVKYKLIEPGYAYVRVTQFQEHTPEKLAAAIDTMWKQNNGQMKGMILDLRNDPGGLLNAAVAISAAFLPQNALVVYTDGRTEDSKMRLYASSEYYLRGSKEDYLKKLPAAVKTVPMVVLVNGGSASASEIVAGALQDHKRAIIMGTQTFGKGSVQTILPLGNNTAIKLTTARYYTPNGRSIQAKGIVPDILVEEATIAEVGAGAAHARGRPGAASVEPDRQGRSRDDAGGSAEAGAEAEHGQGGVREQGRQSRAGRVRLEGRLPAEPGAEPAEGSADHQQALSESRVSTEAGGDPAGLFIFWRKALVCAQPQTRTRTLWADRTQISTSATSSCCATAGTSCCRRSASTASSGCSPRTRWSIGAGGLGSPVSLYLAASGVGRITLCDHDKVDLTNLQRQIVHTTESIGQTKVESGAGSAGAHQPRSPGRGAAGASSKASRLEQLVAAADVVIDATDNFATRHAINRACVRFRKPLVSGAGVRFDGQVAVFDLRRADSPCYHCLFPEEGDLEEMRCAVMGVFAPLVGIIGSMQAAEALKVLMGIGEPLQGRLFLLDALTMQSRTVKLAKDLACKVCGNRAA